MLDQKTVRFVIVMDREMSPGLAANTAAVLAVNAGRDYPDAVGPDIEDASGVVHPGLTCLALTILGAPASDLPDLAQRGRDAGLAVVGFSDLAQSCRHYGEYQERLGAAATSDLGWRGVLFMGEPKAVTKLTSSLPLYK